MPRMSIRNGITDGTKMCGSERVGNCFILLCALYTSQGKTLLSAGLARNTKITLTGLQKCIKLYLAFEQWVNESHPRQEVENACGLLAHLVNQSKSALIRIGGGDGKFPKCIRSPE